MLHILDKNKKREEDSMKKSIILWVIGALVVCSLVSIADTVQKGDTLWGLAEKMGHKGIEWRKFYSNNKNLPKPFRRGGKDIVNIQPGDVVADWSPKLKVQAGFEKREELEPSIPEQQLVVAKPALDEGLRWYHFLPLLGLLGLLGLYGRRVVQTPPPAPCPRCPRPYPLQDPPAYGYCGRGQQIIINNNVGQPAAATEGSAGVPNSPTPPRPEGGGRIIVPHTNIRLGEGCRWRSETTYNTR